MCCQKLKTDFDQMYLELKEEFKNAIRIKIWVRFDALLHKRRYKASTTVCGFVTHTYECRTFYNNFMEVHRMYINFLLVTCQPMVIFYTVCLRSLKWGLMLGVHIHLDDDPPVLHDVHTVLQVWDQSQQQFCLIRWTEIVIKFLSLHNISNLRLC